jgi:nucleotide-binding universal stress UspA family protein
MYKNILVAIDGSAPSQLALSEAIRLAKDGGATLNLLHVVDEFVMGPLVEPSYMSSAYYTDTIDALREAGQQTLKQAETKIRAHGLEPQSTFIEASGRRVGEFVVEQAKKWPADLIVMGTHGRRGLRRLILGSDAEWVLRSAPVPVLLVREQSESDGVGSRS